MLDEAFAAGGEVADVTNLLANARLNEREWRNYARWNKDSFSRVLVADRDDYNMFLVAWERGNFSPVHDHAGSASWTKVLEGELDEAVYGVAPSGELRLERSGPMSAGVTCPECVRSASVAADFLAASTSKSMSSTKQP